MRVSEEWFSLGHLILATALATAGWFAWLRKKQAEIRADRALGAELAHNPLPLRHLGEDHPHGSGLA